MNNLTKPLGVSRKKSIGQIAGMSLLRLNNFPFISLSVAILGSVGFLIAIWVVVVDDPRGGEPIVSVRVIEPKFDSKNRNVELVTVAPLQEVLPPEQKSVELSGLSAVGEEELTPLDPEEILIYDPTKQPESGVNISLSTVAEKGLIEKSRYGFLPKIGSNGEKPLVAYSRPAGAAGARNNQIAIIVGGLGLNDKSTQKTLADLPAETTLAFAPYADSLFDWMSRARSRGHEILLQIPLEPFDYPNNDPGPKTLLVDDQWDANQDRLYWLLSRMTNYVGVVNYMGARFSASPDALRPFFSELRERGLLYVDDGSTPLSRADEVAAETKVAYSQSSLVLDSLLSAEDIDARLLELESLAREKGIAVGIASAFPITIARLKRWAKDAERRGIKLIPISATLNKSNF